MAINIDNLTEAELTDLNNRIVERLRLLDQIRAHSQMLEFKIGDRVTFTPDNRGPVYGVLTRYNKKTVTIITESGQKWTASPALIQRASEDVPPVKVVDNLRKLQSE
jgi:hypothetical protein